MLLPRVSEPGIRLRLPIVDTYEVISFRMQTIPVANLSCNTQGGTHVMFEQAEVGRDSRVSGKRVRFTFPWSHTMLQA